ncbi:fungal-specific transcription factor domain-containing protein [Xylogone sp. PMI_703]|nr:fungal-specific transcription factor domain-containing protein [Xylogone sp. PMI_703]
MPRRPPRSNNTRSFTGCLTCRRRKVKCDEAKPICNTCSRLKVECKGYNGNLQWLHNHGPRGNDLGSWMQGQDAEEPCRRHVIFSVGSRKAMSLELTRQFDSKDILLTEVLDNLDRESSRLGNDITLDKTLSHGPFNVFRAGIPGDPDVIRNGDGDPGSLLGKQGLAQDWSYDMDPSLDSRIGGPLEGPVMGWPEDDWSQMPTTVVVQGCPDLGSPQELSKGDEAIGSPSAYAELVAEQWSEGTFHEPDSWASSTDILISYRPSLPRAPSPPFPQILPKNAQYLLFHYLSQVSHTMSPRNIDSSTLMPWKTIHLPCAMNALGELSAFGVTNYAKASLLHSLLAISAFHLDAKYRTSLPGIDKGGNYRSVGWGNIAQRYKQAAAMNLQKCLELESIRGASKAKYKEILMAVLSMVTIGVISGNTADSHSYLLKSEDIIRTYKLRGAMMSKKIAILHCIFSHIRIIDASTFVKPITSSSLPHSEDTNDNGSISLESQYDELVLSTINLPNMLTSPYETEDQEEAIYGIPSGLLMLISQTSILADELDTFTIQHPHLAIPEDLARRAQMIENQICTWELELMENASSTSVQSLTPSLPPSSSNASLPREDGVRSVSQSVSNAMYYALLVYFFRRVRHTNPVLLQIYVEHVVANLNAHDEAIKLFNLNAGGIVWPSFIVACEASSADLRHRTLQCLYNAGSHGFRNYESAVSVVKEVWRRRDRGSSDVSWVDVLREWGTRLVLT